MMHQTFFFAEKPIGYERGCFMVRKEDPWRYTANQSLEGKRLAAKHGHITGILPNNLLRQLKSIHQNHSGDSALQENLDLLHKGKVDIVLTNVDRIEYFSDYILYQQHFNPAGCIEQTTEQLVTFSPVLDESTFLVEIFNAGLENLKKTGKLNQLRRKYNITNPINQKQ
jgi:ABC-type amino acid transport substrate-binding protein